MSDFLTNLVARSQGTLPVVQPRLPSMFEPYTRPETAPSAATALREREDESSAQVAPNLVKRPTPPSPAESQPDDYPEVQHKPATPHELPEAAPREAHGPVLNANAVAPAGLRQAPPPTSSPQQEPVAAIFTPEPPVLVPRRMPTRESAAMAPARESAAEPEPAVLVPPRMPTRDLAAMTPARGSAAEPEPPRGAPTAPDDTPVSITPVSIVARAEPPDNAATPPPVPQIPVSRQIAAYRQIPVNRRYASRRNSPEDADATAVSEPPPTEMVVARAAVTASEPSVAPVLAGISSAPPPLRQSPKPASAAPQPSIQISIGRVEVRAVFPEPAERRRPAPNVRTTVSLDDYLHRRDQAKP